MNSKVVVLLIVVLAATFVPKSEGFTAGAGNIGRRTIDRISRRFEGICNAAAIYCSHLPEKRFVAESKASE